MSDDNKKGGLLHLISGSGNIVAYKPGNLNIISLMQAMSKKIQLPEQMKISVGRHAQLSMKSAMGEATKEELIELQGLDEQAVARELKKDADFIAKYGQDSFDLQAWLTKTFGNPSPWYDRENKEWTMKSWTDHSDMTERFILRFRSGVYSILFADQDGWGDKIVIKNYISEEYIREAIENYK